MKKLPKKSGQKIVKKTPAFSYRARAVRRRKIEKNIEKNLVRPASHFSEIRIYVIEWCLLVVAIILLAVTQARWYSDSYSVSVFTSGGTFTEATIGKVSSLNPLFASTSSEKAISKLLFSSLATDDYSGHIGLALAQSYTVSDDGKTWTITLRDGLLWSDGEPLTPSDVVFTADLIKNPSVNTPYSSNLSGVKVRLDDVGRIVFTLPSPYADFLTALDFPIVPEHILRDIDPSNLSDSDFSKNPVSSGPFKYNASQSIGSLGEVSVFLAANDHYYLGRPALDSFTIHAYLEKDSVISALNSGSVTATAELSAADATKISSKSIIRRNSAISSAVFAFFNTSNSSVRSASVRSAIRQGINVPHLREIAGDVRNLDYPVLPTQISIDRYPALPAYDPAAASAALADAVASTPVLNVVTVNSGSLPLVAEAFTADLRDLGYEATLTTFEPNQDFITNIIRNRAYDILIYEVELGATSDLLAYYHSSQATSSGLNLSNYKNPYVDDLVLASRTTLDSAARAAKYETFLSFWVDDTPAIALYQSELSYYFNKNTQVFSDFVQPVYPVDRFVDVHSWSTEKTTKNRTP